MATIENNSGIKKSRTGKRMVKKDTRVDLTPMVDLGFLLITFFVFTTTMSKPKVMDVLMPNDKVIKENDPICSSCVLTAVLTSDDAITYYEGSFDTAHLKTADYKSIRAVIQQKKMKVSQARGSADQFVLIIKPTVASSFKNFVDITDEVSINNVKRYYIDELTVAEKAKFNE